MLYTSKITLRFFSIVTLLFSAFCFYSCGDEAIMTSKEEFDPPRYSWESDTIEAIVVDLWAFDSNNVYLADEYYNLIHFDGSNYNYHDYGGDIFVTAMSGYDQNNIYAAGRNLYNGKWMVKKWNGTVFENITVSDTIYNNTIITSIRAYSPSNIWLCTSNGRVFKFNGSSFEPYYLDGKSFIRPVLFDDMGGVYVAGGEYFPSYPIFDSVRVFINKLENGVWHNSYEEMLIESTESTVLKFCNIGKEIVRVKRHSILRYDGFDFSENLKVDQFSTNWAIFGLSLQNILCVGTQDGYSKSLYHWNGTKWSKELGVSELSPQRVFGLGNKYFVTYSDYDTFETIVYKGKMKH